MGLLNLNKELGTKSGKVSWPLMLISENHYKISERGYPAMSPHCWNIEQNLETLLQLTLHSNLQKWRQTKRMKLHKHCVALGLFRNSSKVLLTSVTRLTPIHISLYSLLVCAVFHMMSYLTQLHGENMSYLLLFTLMCLELLFCFQ